jgi:ABC-2 family transporter protein
MSDHFGWLLRAEWTKFRTVRGWIVGIAASAMLMVGFGLLTTVGSGGSDAPPDGDAAMRTAPVGPGGESVNDHFFFVHQVLDGDGSITARVSSLTGTRISPRTHEATPASPQPWAKAGLIIKDGTTPGSAYGAVTITGGHGVRLQHNYTGDVAGPAGAVTATSPRWLKLTRTGDTVTGYASTDGVAWAEVGAVRLDGLASTVHVGLFVTSPFEERFEQFLGGTASGGNPTAATATFDRISVVGASSGTWQGLEVGADPRGGSISGFRRSGDSFTVTGAGDIAPVAFGPKFSIERTLAGVFVALIVLVVVAVLFVTTEYRRGLIRTSLSATPRRINMLVAKAVVIGGVTFVVGLVAAAVTLPLIRALLRDNGLALLAVSAATEVRIVVGTAALIAVVSVLALALGTIMRRSVGAIAAVIVLTVLPYLLTMAGVLPVQAAQWVLRVTPAAAFAIQQSIPAYPQVNQAYWPSFGFYPLAPWAGFAVLCGWTAVALGLAGYLLRRRDV